MKRQSVDSSMIASVGFDAKAGKIEIEFKGTGQVWRYGPASQEDFDRMMAAPSIGKFYNQHIKGVLDGERS